jgi:hypothetical protein
MITSIQSLVLHEYAFGDGFQIFVRALGSGDAFLKGCMRALLWVMVFYEHWLGHYL